MTISTNEAADFKAAYMLAFDTVATDPSQVATLDGINIKYARTILAALVKEGLLVKTESNGEDVWQTPFGTDDTEREDAEAVIDEWIAAQVGTPDPTSATPQAKAPKQAKEPKPCLCGCGEMVPSKSFYRPGHDARHAGVVGRRVADEFLDGHIDSTSVEHFEALPSDRLKVKAQAIALKAVKKAEAKHAKANGQVEATPVDEPADRKDPLVEVGTVTVGKNTYEAARFATGEVGYKKPGSDVTHQASKTAAKTFKPTN